jgi:magnesium chelatase family protein
MHAKALGATPRGVGALFVTVEVDRLRATMPAVTIVGLPDTAVREARERIFAAIRHLGRRPEPANVVFNLAPADERKEGASLDLPMAVAFLCAVGALPPESIRDRVFMGELSLEGELQPCRGVLPVVVAASRTGPGGGGRAGGQSRRGAGRAGHPQRRLQDAGRGGGPAARRPTA